MEISVISNLLEKISLINKKYEEFARITGENFNVFKILGVQTDEVRTHSAFLCELLNTKGSHDCGKIFLELFVKQLKEKTGNPVDSNGKKSKFVEVLKNFNFDKATTISEEFIGNISEDHTEGGRIDIVIKDSNSENAIIIENKINAPDKNCQLLRYKKAYQNPVIFYLTLDGKTPSEISTNNELKKGEDYVCISYKEDIVLWLESCIKEVAKKPIIRETITQYINLIKYLTGQTMNKKMEEEIIKIMTSCQENIDAAFLIRDNTNRLISKFNETIELQINEIAIGEIKPEIIKVNNNFSDFIFMMPSWERYKISLSFSQGGLGKAIIGVTTDEQDKENEKGLPKIEGFINKECPNEYKFQRSDYWPIYHELYSEDSEIYKSYNFYSDIKSGEFKKKVKKFIEIIIKSIEYTKTNFL